MKTKISPQNDSLRKEFYATIWDHVKVRLLVSLKMAFLRKELSTFQKLAVLKPIEKKDRDRRFIIE